MHLGEERAYALAITDEIERRTGRRARRSAVYVTLKRMEEKGLVATRLGQPRAERGGRARRLVRPTGEGLAAVHESRTALERMWSGLDTAPETP